jgi:PAS domain S-box-containing protein
MAGGLDMKRKKDATRDDKTKIHADIHTFDQITSGALPDVREPVMEAARQLVDDLKRSEARFRTIFENSILGWALLNLAGEIVDSNPAMQKMLGYTREELEGKTFDIYSHPADAETNRKLRLALAMGEAGDYQKEKRFVRKDGQVRWGQWTVSLVHVTKRQEPEFALAMLEDITERKKSQDFLLRAERLAIVGRLGASLAHEINNPLQAALGCLGLADEALEDGTDVRLYLTIAMDELERAAGVVSRLRNLVREPEKRKKQRANLNKLLEKALVLIRKRCQDQGVDVKWDRTADLSLVPIVADHMQQVFLNLLLNAVESMPDGGELEVSTISLNPPQGLRITIADTGKGIEPELLSNIFEPFYSTRPEGMGLGLYISKKIVEDEHGGRLEVESQVGKGSAFSVWLPG